MKAICFVCETLTHILNCINYMTFQQDFEEVRADIFIRREPFTAGIAERLSEERVFRTAVEFRYFRIQNNLKDILRITLAPKEYLTEALGAADTLPDSYDYIYVAYPTRFVFALTLAYSRAVIRCYDDGIGTYIDNIPHPVSFAHSFMYWLRLRKNPWKRVDGLYVYNPSCCDSPIAPKIALCPPDFMAGTNGERIRSFFRVSRNPLYDSCQAIFLSQPLDGLGSEYTRITRQTIDALKPWNALVRFHFRETDFYCADLPSDRTNELWELICADQICERHVLVARFSTAQFTPKLLYGKEPYIICTHKLYSEIFPAEVTEKISEVVRRFRILYRNPEKVMMPENMDEFLKDVRAVCSSALL